MTRRLALSLTAAALALTGCAAAGGVPETSDTPRRDLAATPSPLAGTHAGKSATGHKHTARPPHTGPTAGIGSTGPSSTAAGSGDSNSQASTGGTRTSTASFRGFAALTDPARDAGLDAPAYADLRSITLADNGQSLRVEVTVAGTLPAQAEAGETIGIGVDLYRPGTARESDYQLFADGEPDGWFAYLDTPRGFVRYPGTFALGGSRLIFTVPWSSVGNPRTGRFSAFVDWSRRSTAVTGNKSSNDYAPIAGTKTYAR
jgi:hypothetical protein